MITSIFWINLVLLFWVGWCQYQCHDAESCIFDSISVSSQIIECYGYRSCEQTSELTASTGGYVFCLGSYSCYESTDISITSGCNNILCSGLFACAKVERNSNECGGSIYCDGEQSCIDSKLMLLGSLPYLYCDGDMSCKGSTIMTRETVWFYGAYSGMNTVIYSNESAIYIWFEGAYSGYNATIICGVGHSCGINCNGPFACDYFNKVSCADGTNTSCTITIGDWYVDIPSNLEEKFPSLLNVTRSTYENSYYPCYSSVTGSITCDDYQECDSSTSSYLTTSDAPICCLAYGACSNSNNISATIPIGDSLIGETGIRCDGVDSCEFASMLYASNGHIYATATGAANGYTNGGIIMKTGDRDLYNIYCTALQACRWYAYISDCNNLYCLGSYSCYSASLISNVNNVYAYGYQSAYSVQLIEYVDNVYCSSSQACYGTTIEHVKDSVWGMGYAVIQDSTIYNVTNVYCMGQDSCYGTTLRAIHNEIYIYDNNRKPTSIISETNFDNDGTLLIYISGDYLGDTWDIYCNSTDTCKVKCVSSQACTRLSMHCNNNCFVNCDESNGIDCPYNGIWSDWTTYEPTSMPSSNPSLNPSMEPSLLPSSIPTAIPSTIPTYDPSMNPSYDPTSIPSGIPSKMPSIMPSDEPSSNPSSMPSKIPSMEPSNNPTQYPSGVPSNEPTDVTNVPSSIPSALPSSVPSAKPSIMPSAVPSAVPTAISTSNNSSQDTNGDGDTDTGDSGDNSASASSGDNSTLDATSIIIIVAIISVTLLICIGMILMYAHLNNSNKNKNNVKSNEAIMNEIELNKVRTFSGANGAIGSGTVSPRTTDNNNNNNNTIVMTNIEDSYDKELEAVFSDLNDNDEDNENNDELYEVKKGGTEGEGLNKQGTVTGGDDNDSDLENNNNNNDKWVIDDSKFSKWSQKEVIVWLKLILLKNNFEKRIILSFLREFATKYITGQTLVQFQANDKLVDGLISQFSRKNQGYGIWLAIKSGIQDLGKQTPGGHATTQ